MITNEAHRALIVPKAGTLAVPSVEDIRVLNLCAMDPTNPIVLSFMHYELSLLGPPLFVCVALNAKSFTGTPLPKVKLVTMFAQKLGWGPPAYSEEDVTEGR